MKIPKHTPEEEAQRIIDDFKYLKKTEKGKCIDPMYELYNCQSIECALIHVNRIIEATKRKVTRFRATTLEVKYVPSSYWLEVKGEILKRRNT